MKKIFAATDFSPAGDNAALYAAGIAHTTGATLTLLHVESYPVIRENDGEGNWLDRAFDVVRTAMDVLVYHARKQYPGLQVEGQLFFGDYLDEIQQKCKREQPDLVVIGNQGKSAAEHFFFGSNALDSLREIRYPLLAVPPGYTFNGISNIALACDVEHTLDTLPVVQVAGFANYLNATLHLLYAGREEDKRPVVAAVQAAFGTLQPRFQFTDSFSNIPALARAVHADLLIVLPRTHGFFEHLLHRSRSRHLLEHSNMPILVLH